LANPDQLPTTIIHFKGFEYQPKKRYLWQNFNIMMEYDYNTSREKLILPEYGRNIQKMVKFAINVEDRDERTRVAYAIISIMGNMNPGLREQGDYKRKLWDHLAIMSDFKLDIDAPYELPEREDLFSKPARVNYPSNKIRYKHYGRATQEMVNHAVSLDEGEEKSALIQLVANHMKRQYLTYNREVVTDDAIFEDLKELAGGNITIDPNLKLADQKDLVPPVAQQYTHKSKRKKGNSRKGPGKR